MGHRFSSAMWYPVLDALTAHHRVIWFDNRGAGDSGITRQASIGDLVHGALDGAGHNFLVTSPERSREAVLGFLRTSSAHSPGR